MIIEVLESLINKKTEQKHQTKNLTKKDWFYAFKSNLYWCFTLSTLELKGLLDKKLNGWTRTAFAINSIIRETTK